VAGVRTNPTNAISSLSLARPLTVPLDLSLSLSTSSLHVTGSASGLGAGLREESPTREKRTGARAGVSQSMSAGSGLGGGGNSEGVSPPYGMGEEDEDILAALTGPATPCGEPEPEEDEGPADTNRSANPSDEGFELLGASSNSEADAAGGSGREPRELVGINRPEPEEEEEPDEFS